MTAVTTVQPGEVLNGTYRLERLIGSGGMGMVFEASHMRVPRKFAIKVLNPEAIGHRDVFERFQREAEIASGLGHEHIAHVFDFNYTPAGMPYMVLEYLEGHDLGARLRQEGRLSIPATLAILSQVGAALDAAHVGRIIHRDLKPTNIFLWRRGPQEDFVKILDFGISKIVHASSSATRTGLILGTPNYMAPEQAEGRHQEVDHRVDLFALGAIAYECLTGRMAFDAPTPIGTMYQVCHSTPPPIRAFAPQVTEAIERVVARAMAKSRDARYPTSAAMLADLAAAAEGLPTDHPSALPTVPTPIYTPPVSTTLDQSASQKVTPLPRPLRRGRRGAIAVALALVAGGAIAALLVTPAAAPPRVVQPIAAPAPAPPVVEPVRLALPPPVVERFELVGLGTALAAEVSFEPGEDLPALPQLRLRAPPKSKAKPKAKPAGRKPNLGPVEQSL